MISIVISVSFDVSGVCVCVSSVSDLEKERERKITKTEGSLEKTSYLKGSFFQTPDLENFSFSVPSLKYGGFQSSTQKHLTSRTARRSRQFMGIFVLIGLIDSLIAAKI